MVCVYRGKKALQKCGENIEKEGFSRLQINQKHESDLKSLKIFRKTKLVLREREEQNMMMLSMVVILRFHNND